MQPGRTSDWGNSAWTEMFLILHILFQPCNVGSRNTQNPDCCLNLLCGSLCMSPPSLYWTKWNTIESCQTRQEKAKKICHAHVGAGSLWGFPLLYVHFFHYDKLPRKNKLLPTQWSFSPHACQFRRGENNKSSVWLTSPQWDRENAIFFFAKLTFGLN